MEKGFTKEDTNCVKGVAVLFLLLHHVLNNKYPYVSILIGDSYDYLSPLVNLSKVCVYIFFILSGYGLYMSFSKESHSFKNTIKFVVRHILKLYSMFWIIYIIFVPIGVFFGRSPSSVYAGDWSSAIYDFLGLAYLTNHTSFLATWWYFGMSLLFYALFPIIYFIVQKLDCWSLAVWGGLALLALKYYGWKLTLIYCIPFILGIILAHTNGIVKISYILQTSRTKKIIKLLIYVVLILGYCVFRLKVMSKDMFYYRLDWILAVLCICVVYDYIPDGSIIRRVLSLIGKNSGNIYLMHAFVYSLYFKEFVYSFKYAIVIYIIVLMMSLIISRGLELLKDVIGYNKFFGNLYRKLI